MIEYLKLRNVGLSPLLEIHWAKRVNLITGDNGLGKSFLLDLAWWSLTRTWAGNVALPANPKETSNIDYGVLGASKSVSISSSFRRSDSSWQLKAARPSKQGVVVYVQVDGGFSVWDSARNYWRNDAGRPDAYHFKSDQVWDGLDINGVRVCEGLERDWVSWQKGNEPQYKALCDVIYALSPTGEKIQPGPPMRVFIGEGRDRPTLRFGDQVVPIALASSGVRRILALAYFLVWAWFEHKAAAELLGKKPEKRLVLLFDEPETHLHPRWQRTILTSIIAAVQGLRGSHAVEPQIIVATHAPLILASAEPWFDETKDDLMHLSLTDHRVQLQQGMWTKQGDASNWLVSEVFGLHQARSFPAENAIEAAEAWMRGDDYWDANLRTKDAIHQELVRVLPGHDKFWPRWIVKSGAIDEL